MTDYHPIDCGLHSQYELWIMHRTRILLHWDQDGKEYEGLALPVDIRTLPDGEYLFLEEQDGQIRIRLDRIISAQPA